MNNVVKKLSRFCVCSSVCVFLLGMVTTASATVPDALWQKAVEITEESTWIPGQVLQHEQVMDTKGKIQENTETEIKLAPGQNGKIAVTVVKAVSNGKDVTKDARKEADGEVETDEIIDSINPFAETEQENLTITRLERKKIIQGKHCIAFQYSLNADSSITDAEEKVSIEGIAWIDEMTGIPYEIESEITSVPMKEDKLTINTFRQVEHYDYVNGQWIQVGSVMDMDIEFKAFLIKFKGTVHSVSQYSRHWKL